MSFQQRKTDHEVQMLFFYVLVDRLRMHDTLEIIALWSTTLC